MYRNRVSQGDRRPLARTGIARLEIELAVPRAREIVRYKRYNIAVQVGTIGEYMNRVTL